MENLVKGDKKSRLSRLLVKAARTNDKRLHVLPLKGKWGVRLEGSKRIYGVYVNKASAMKFAEGRARSHGNTMIIVHDKDGRISSISTIK